MKVMLLEELTWTNCLTHDRLSQEIDPRAGGGRPITIGEMCQQLLTRLDWYTTLFPR